MSSLKHFKKTFDRLCTDDSGQLSLNQVVPLFEAYTRKVGIGVFHPRLLKKEMLKHILSKNYDDHFTLEDGEHVLRELLGTGRSGNTTSESSESETEPECHRRGHHRGSSGRHLTHSELEDEINAIYSLRRSHSSEADREKGSGHGQHGHHMKTRHRSPSESGSPHGLRHHSTLRSPLSHTRRGYHDCGTEHHRRCPFLERHGEGHRRRHSSLSGSETETGIRGRRRRHGTETDLDRGHHEGGTEHHRRCPFLERYGGGHHRRNRSSSRPETEAGGHGHRRRHGTETELNHGHHRHGFHFVSGSETDGRHRRHCGHNVHRSFSTSETDHGHRDHRRGVHRSMSRTMRRLFTSGSVTEGNGTHLRGHSKARRHRSPTTDRSISRHRGQFFGSETDTDFGRHSHGHHHGHHSRFDNFEGKMKHFHGGPAHRFMEVHRERRLLRCPFMFSTME
ncbi:hypothetical protein L596_027831 [Steinernema carpocapsae]|uniref:Uncharacterized protein n=1 Tax=Steinernema carpocapsae TaxID=34508 RepID=A0A4U5LWP4_STECR|nr:hypothetical protein L596_027831 [Steinernema carpocapsae]